ncbi:HD domain-containing protein [Candidatus Woesearchaeota archaeon]|nr:HD domain-containing protein [Candidatus Woesearchaeota archaeon]
MERISGRVICSRKIQEDLEHEHKERCVKLGFGLAEQFTLSSESRGRLKDEADDGDWRTIFRRDYDRLIWSDGHARLRNKSQTALHPVNQEITTRLIHVIKVAQLAVRNCQFLFLNPDLGGAIGIGHDNGHTPFGHAGERAITEIVQEILCNPDYEFHHARYGLEIVDRIENNGKGINLSLETRDGILNHSRGEGSVDAVALRPFTPEGEVAVWADKFAYTSSDISDFLKLGVISESDLPQSELRLLGCGDRYSKSRILDELNYGLVTSSLEEGRVCFNGERREAFDVIRKWMFNNVYGHDKLEDEFKKAQDMIKRVFSYVLATRFKNLPLNDAVSKTIDVVACMTDVSMMEYFDDISKPKRIY